MIQVVSSSHKNGEVYRGEREALERVEDGECLPGKGIFKVFKANI